jgi:hypothetical protein
MRASWKSCVWTLLVDHGFVGVMPEADENVRRDIIRRLFYLITIAAEDAAALAVEGQLTGLSPDCARASAAGLRDLGMRIEILSSIIPGLTVDVGKSDRTA